MIDLKNITIVKARKALDAKEFSAVELAEAYLEQIKKKNKELNAYLKVYDDVLAQAEAADKMIKKGETYPMLGIPIAIKGVILIEGKISSASSKILENYIASYDSTAIKKLKKQGAVFLGETNLDEFAMGGSTENSAFGPTRNPYDTERVAGGSSGGSVVAVAADMALAALGSDTGGSVREPAAFCNIVGLKPTYGRVSRYGLMALGSSLDCIGPVAKTVEDAEILLRVVAGHDPMDSTSIKENMQEKKVKDKLNIGVPWDLINQEGVNASVKENFTQAIEKIKKLGHEVQEVSLPSLGLGLAIYYILMPAEASSNLARYDGVRYGLHLGGDNLFEDYKITRGKGFGAEPRRRVLLGTYVLSAGYYDAYYGKAQSARSVLKREFSQAFEKFDLILTPTVPIPAWKIGEKTDPLSVYLADVFTITANIVGLPAISIPSGFIKEGGKDLPVGIQFIAPHEHEDLLFSVGKKFESSGK